MMDIYIPDMYSKSIYHINYDKLKEDGIKCILFDLDNTIIPYKEKTPSKKLIDLIENLRSKCQKTFYRKTYKNNKRI